MREMVPEGSKCLFSQCEKRHFGSFLATDKFERRNSYPKFHFLTYIVYYPLYIVTSDRIKHFCNKILMVIIEIIYYVTGTNKMFDLSKNN